MNAMTTSSLPTGSIKRNGYNPNRMAPEKFNELVEEVRHLGRVPKPIVVRADDDGHHIIVDGEHAWRAAQEAGLESITAEVIDVDDFEARRQTFKRNQHGEHDPVLLGRMFRDMMAERDLSQRALAKEITVSEGTIRNALLYAEAAGLRNRYALDQGDADDNGIAALTVRQCRAYCRLPAPIRDYWLDDGADLKLLDDISMNIPEPWAKPGDRYTKIELSYEQWSELIDLGIASALKEYRFSYARKLWGLWA